MSSSSSSSSVTKRTESSPSDTGGLGGVSPPGGVRGVSPQPPSNPWSQSKKRAKTVASTTETVAPTPLPDDPLRLSVTLRDASAMTLLLKKAKSAHIQQIQIEFSDTDEDALVEFSASLLHNAGWFTARVPVSACVQWQLENATKFAFAVAPSDALAVKNDDKTPRTLTIEHPECSDNTLRMRSCDATNSRRCPDSVVMMPCQDPDDPIEIDDNLYEKAVRVRLLASTLHGLLPASEAKRLFFTLEARADSFTLRPHEPNAKGMKSYVCVAAGKATEKGQCEIDMGMNDDDDDKSVVSVLCYSTSAVDLWNFATGARSVELAFGCEEPIRARFRFDDGTLVSTYVLEAISEEEL